MGDGKSRGARDLDEGDQGEERGQGFGDIDFSVTRIEVVEPDEVTTPVGGVVTGGVYELSPGDIVGIGGSLSCVVTYDRGTGMITGVSMTRPCGDCGVQPGELHVQGCDMEGCPRCGGQAIACNCIYEVCGLDVSSLETDHPDIYSNGATDEMWARFDQEWGSRRIPWAGEHRLAAAARDLGLWCVWEAGPNQLHGSWKQVPAGTPGATEDLNRLQVLATWSAEHQRWRPNTGIQNWRAQNPSIHEELLAKTRESRGLVKSNRSDETHMVPSQTRFNPFYDSGGYAECYVCGIGSYKAADGHPNNGCSAVVDGPMLVFVGNEAKLVAEILATSPRIDGSWIDVRLEALRGIGLPAETLLAVAEKKTRD